MFNFSSLGLDLVEGTLNLILAREMGSPRGAMSMLLEMCYETL